MNEYRVLWYEKRGTFKCYDTLGAAEARVESENRLAKKGMQTYPESNYKIQQRPSGTQGDDSTWKDA